MTDMKTIGMMAMGVTGRVKTGDVVEMNPLGRGGRWRRLIPAVAALVMAAGLSWVPATAQAGSFTRKDVSQVGWSVAFEGASYDPASDQTTFYYQLTAQSWEKDLSHWVLAFGGSFVAATPSSPVALGLDPTTGLVGLKWDGGQKSGTTETYSLTVKGLAFIGFIDYAVKGGTYYAVGQTFGPAGPFVSQLYSISGNVYLDANDDQTLDAGEPSLPEVEVQLFDNQGSLVAETTTDASGGYSFDSLGAGTYVVSIPSDATNAFNPSLTRYFSSPQEALPVTLANTDSTGNNFAFVLDPVRVIADFDSNDSDGNGVVLTGTGRTIGFWKHQLTVALTHRGHAQIDAATLLDDLYSVQGLYLADPFQFPPGSEYSQALDILAARTSDAVGLLKKQLLATELNHVAGLGLDNKTLQGVLINWSEYLAANDQSFSRENLLSAQVICDLINNTGE